MNSTAIGPRPSRTRDRKVVAVIVWIGSLTSVSNICNERTPHDSRMASFESRFIARGDCIPVRLQHLHPRRNVVIRAHSKLPPSNGAYARAHIGVRTNFRTSFAQRLDSPDESFYVSDRYKARFLRAPTRSQAIKAGTPRSRATIITTDRSDLQASRRRDSLTSTSMRSHQTSRRRSDRQVGRAVTHGRRAPSGFACLTDRRSLLRTASPV